MGPTHPGSPVTAVCLALASCGGGAVEPASARTAASGVPEATESALFCSAPEVDLGGVWEGAVLSHTFELEVRGSAPAAFREVKADCGCTATELRVEGGGPYELGTALVPGTRLLLDVRVDTSKRRGRSLRGVEILGAGRTRVGISADVRPWLEVEMDGEPLGAPVTLPPSREASTDRVVLVARSATGEPFGLTHDRRGVPDMVGVEVLPAGEADGDGRAEAWKVSVTLGPELPRGRRAYPIHLVTDRTNPDAPDGAPFGAVPLVSVERVGAVALSPAVLDLGVLDPETTVSRTLRLIGHDPDVELPEPVGRLLHMTTDEPSPLAETARVTARAVGDRNAWDVELLLAGLPDAVEGRALARLVLETGHPDEPLVEAKILLLRLGGAASPAGRASSDPFEAGGPSSPDPPPR